MPPRAVLVERGQQAAQRGSCRSGSAALARTSA